MKLSNLSYLFSIVLFCAPLLLITWKREGRILKKYELTLLAVIIVSIPISASEFFALSWKVWKFGSEAVLPIRLGGQIETHIFLVAVIWLVGSIILILATWQDKRQQALKRKNKQAVRVVKQITKTRKK